jgi:hypothetical protein
LHNLGRIGLEGLSKLKTARGAVVAASGDFKPLRKFSRRNGREGLSKRHADVVEIIIQ